MPEDPTQQNDAQQDPEGKAPDEPVNDEEYEDVLYAALKSVYKEIDGVDDEGDDEGGEPKAKPTVADLSDLSKEELLSRLSKTEKTLKDVVALSLQDREEQNAVKVWNGFLEQASETEKQVARTFAFEVSDKTGMERQIAQVKKTAAEVEKVIQAEVSKRSEQQKGQMQSRYGILSPEPMSDEDLAAKDKRDLENQNYASIIARRFARRG